ncbi:hypothetical protein NliqN6_0170 [Naganishia liquefaciens]|uniref:DUF2421 domain-containing protein n=1 Tax=Naganishia liquefaciens TaxID=104408 RepID=A0A8H3YC30_9TREE|nr:hypothetical protein NliqN6_0170 [Naganishia liquefaciens]
MRDKSLFAASHGAPRVSSHGCRQAGRATRSPGECVFNDMYKYYVGAAIGARQWPGKRDAIERNVSEQQTSVSVTESVHHGGEEGREMVDGRKEFSSTACPSSAMQIPQARTPQGDVMYSWQGVRGILESLEGDISREREGLATPARSTRSRRSRRSRSERRGWSASPGIGEWSVDSIEEEASEEEENHGRRQPHRRTDTNHTIRPVFARDVATHHEEQLLEGGETPLSTSPEAEPSSILSPRNPQRLSTPSLKKVPPSRIRKHPPILTSSPFRSHLIERRVQSQTIPSGDRTPLLAARPKFPRAYTDDGVRPLNPPSKIPPPAPSYWTTRLRKAITSPSPNHKRIFKCSIAYLIASLFTFVPVLSASLSTSHEIDVHGRERPRPAYSAHMVATVMVYFHPGRSIGSMILASKYCVILATLAALTCLGAIATLATFDRFFPDEDTLGFEAGDLIVCVFWIGGSMGGLAWLKQWVNNPSFNTGCSMAAVTLFTVVVKEGGISKLTEVLLIVVIGATISNIVCYTLWPQSATTRLQNQISTTIDSFATLFRLLQASFLLDRPPNDASYASLQVAAKAHSAAFTQLKADLAEAQEERLVDGRIGFEQRQRYAAVTSSLTRLAQHLTGMRGGTGLQGELLRGKAPRDGDTGSNSSGTESDDEKDLAEAGNLFWAFRDQVADELRQLTDLSCKVLHDVKIAMTDLDSSSDHSALLHQDHDLLQAALNNLSKTTITAINRLYHATLDGQQGGATPSTSDASNEAVYLIYFFIFTLEEFVREEIQLVEAMCELVAGSQGSHPSGLAKWFSPSAWREVSKRKTIGRGILKVDPLDPSDLQPPLFPKKDKNSPNTLTIPARSTLTRRERIYQKLWKLQARLKENDIKYAIKVGLGTVILSAPAFTATYHDTFLEFRGEWALIAFWATMSLSVGSTNLSFYRVAGTILGAVVAVVIYTLFPDDHIVLPIFGFLFSLPCFWIVIHHPAYQQAGRFILLTYNLTCLYAYNQRETDLSAVDIGWRRATSVVVGVLWATFVSNYWWPFAARTELRVGLSDFCLDLAYLYSRLVRVYSQNHDESCIGHPLVDRMTASDVLAPSAPSISMREVENEKTIREFMSMELHLQIQLIQLRALLTQTANEPRLKGPFPRDTYGGIINSCQTMLDKLHSMRCVTTRQEWDNTIHRDFIRPVNKERKEMVGNVILYFYLLAASLRLRFPMPASLPPAETARLRLIAAMSRLDVSVIQSRRQDDTDTRLLLYFAYAMAMKGVIQELEYLGETLQDVFGIINQSTRAEFDALFV